MPRKVREPKILTLDTETIGLDGDLKRIAIYDGESVTYGYTFSDIEPQIKFWYKQGYMPHIYIHNADFDLRKIPEVFALGNVTWGRTKIIGNKFARIQCKNYVIHDSFKLLPMSLAKLSKDFDLTHGKKDLWEEVKKAYPGMYTDHIDFLARCNKDDPVYLEYLGYDVMSLYELILKLMELSRMPLEKFVMCLSTASMSKYILKNGWGDHKFQTDGIDDYEKLEACKAWSSEKKLRYSTKTYVQIEDLMRYGFYGGRTEVFTPRLEPDAGKVVGYHFDVNSLYPSVMSLKRVLSGISVGLDFPIGYPEIEENAKSCEIKFNHWLRDHFGLGFVHADVFVPEQYIPPLPAKMGKLAFVCGHITGCWTYTELEYAIKNCGVKIEKFHALIHFRNTHAVFKNFVECFYKMKDEGKRTGNIALTSFAKLLLNTAYGWTVLRRDDKTAFRDIEELPKWKDTDRYITHDDELGYVEIWDTVYSKSIQVQIGAYVTSYARLVLLDALRKQSETGNVYYCDTDSIVTDHYMPPEMVDEYEIGKWDCENHLLYGIFLQPKVYYEKTTKKETIKYKGVSKARQKELDSEFYEKLYAMIASGERVQYMVEDHIERLPSLHVAQKKRVDANKLAITSKTMHIGKKQKREFDYENNVSKPFFMENLNAFETFSFAEFVSPPNKDEKYLYGKSVKL